MSIVYFSFKEKGSVYFIKHTESSIYHVALYWLEIIN